MLCCGSLNCHCFAFLCCSEPCCAVHVYGAGPWAKAVKALNATELLLVTVRFVCRVVLALITRFWPRLGGAGGSDGCVMLL